MVDYAPKTSVKNLSTLLQNVTVLVVDPDPPIANIIKHVLSNLGFGNILIEHEGAGAVSRLKKHTVDFIISDFDVFVEETQQSFIEYVRTSPESKNPCVPIILLTGHTEQQEIHMARDMGVSEIAAKPFTAKSLCDRIVRIIENPRSFIITKRYTGPDRRRKADGPPSSGDRREMPTTAPVSKSGSSSARGVVKKERKGIFGRFIGRKS